MRPISEKLFRKLHFILFIIILYWENVYVQIFYREQFNEKETYKSFSRRINEKQVHIRRSIILVMFHGFMVYQ